MSTITPHTPEKAAVARRYLTAPMVAAEYGLPVASLATWRSRGRGPAYVKVGSRVLYCRSDVERFLELRRVDPVEAATEAGGS